MPHFEVNDVSEDLLDLEAVAGFRWWSVDEIEASDEAFAPRRLGVLLRALLRDETSDEPADAGL